MFTTPIAISTYTRVESVKSIISQLEVVQPSTLLIFADHPTDKDFLTYKQQYLAHKEVLTLFDNLKWKCTIHKLISDEHLGIYHRFTSALKWFNEIADRVICLEDDVIPSLNFFKFCQQYIFSDHTTVGINLLPTHTNLLTKYCLPLWGVMTSRDVRSAFLQFLTTFTPTMNIPPISHGYTQSLIDAQYTYLRHQIYQCNAESIDIDVLFNAFLQCTSRYCIVPHNNLITYTGNTEPLNSTADEISSHLQLESADILTSRVLRMAALAGELPIKQT